MSNRTTEDKWDAEINRWTPGRIKAWIAIFVIVALFGGVVTWGLRVATSDTKGRGDTVVRENSADNRIGAQAFFEDTYASVKKFDTQLTDATEALEEWKASNPVPSGASSVQAELYKEELNNKQTSMTGIKQQCQNATAAYNAEARKTIRSKWRSQDLPYQIDGTDPATDCEVAA